MDGNRRWAKSRGLPSFIGHQKGLDKIKEVAGWAQDAGVKELILYAFSTENWNRSEEEITYLLQLFEKGIQNFLESINDVYERKGRIRFIGQRERFSTRIQELMQEAEEKTKNGDGGTLVIALSYGGRTEILEAAKALQGSKEEITEESFRKHMWSKDLSDPDIIIRTGGEMRLSNFLAWQSVYSELFFTDTKWPGFTKREFLSILKQFEKRHRRKGR